MRRFGTFRRLLRVAAGCVEHSQDRQLDGTPANLTRPIDCPVEALCLECGQPIRCERWFLGGWAHIARFSNPEGS
jgi:hypothetical protein